MNWQPIVSHELVPNLLYENATFSPEIYVYMYYVVPHLLHEKSN